MKPEDFCHCLELLTGSPTAGLEPCDSRDFAAALADDARLISSDEFNELLLLAGKDHVTQAFFSFFFCLGGDPLSCRVGEIPMGVTRFQKTAMLRYGNFIYAYRKLSRIDCVDGLKEEVGETARDPTAAVEELSKRSGPMLDIAPIARDDTYLVGYISAAEVVADFKCAEFLKRLLAAHPANWSVICSEVRQTVPDSVEARRVERTATALRGSTAVGDHLGDLPEALDRGLNLLTGMKDRLEKVRAVAARNSDVYLSWLHMDVYFATSMRKRWEFEDLYDLVEDVTGDAALDGLHLRHFDPTQSFERDRIAKGLIEGLMLKRAACTVYSVQDVDTLGKDSELAATLAQGKPVIAFAPKMDVQVRARQLASLRPAMLIDRLQAALSTDDRLLTETDDALTLLEAVREECAEFESSQPWKSLVSEDALAAFRRAHAEDLQRLSLILAQSEQRIYDKRADNLMNTHPLAIQVALGSGVANGVLVARDAATCAKLVRQILTNELDFDLVLDVDTDCWQLRERLTGSIFRVVTRNPRVTNSFWNFYLRAN